MPRLIWTGLILTLLTGFPAAAQDFEKGKSAYKSANYAVALKEFRPLAARGHAEAQTYLGLMYENGRGVPVDNVEAVKWFEKAALQGAARVQWHLGEIFRRGRKGIARNPAGAARWYRMAAAQGHGMAQFQLGYMYSRGQGVKRDDVLAYMWLDLSADTKKSRSKIRDIHAHKMSSSQIAEAKKLAQEWRKKSRRN